jgi:sec-independent protein translocase protein TatB
MSDALPAPPAIGGISPFPHPSGPGVPNKDCMLNLDPSKLLVIAVVGIVLLGPDRLPQVARHVGEAWRTFNEYRHRMEREVRSSMPDLPSTAEIARLARSPSALLNRLSAMSPDLEGSESAPPSPPPTVAGQRTEPASSVAPQAARSLTRPVVTRPHSSALDPHLPGDPGLN